MPPTSTPIPQIGSTPFFDPPGLWDIAPDVSQGWMLMGQIGSVLQVAILLVIIAFGLWVLYRFFSRLNDE
jgi:hypothetical protein